MTYQNVGAQIFPAGMDVPTKTALKVAIANTPEKVYLYSTDAMGPNYKKSWMADNLEIGVKYSVTGPNPYTSRRWFATVEKTDKGITVK